LNINAKNRTSHNRNKMKLLSIVIVSYNVKYFLEQCLYAVQKAAKACAIPVEIIVVDNCSQDNSIRYLREQFPFIQFIINKENAGYARANNQGWRSASGDVVLFLNPDTIIGEESLQQSLEVLEKYRDVGAVGVRMVDGSGQYLPESKRGLPTPAASFYKLSGLINLFPDSEKIAQYYMGHLDNRKNFEVYVLAGAYMMVRKAVLEETGGFDEQFFMYGEDVDLSYRIQKAGYKNVYIGQTTIIHFKGESTRKDIRYVKQFYHAMRLFAKKHFRAQAWWLSVLIEVIIACRLGLYYLQGIFYFNINKSAHHHTTKTLVVAASGEAKQAMQIFDNYPTIKRNIRIAAADIQLGEITTYDKFNEIVFVAGENTYQHIIEQIEQYPSTVLYWFTALGSKSMVCSYSKKEPGDVLIISETAQALQQ
jgi:N-acetylglucosaminyl-diphospho-decaprenol L-rhamnosyltransferase